MKERLHTPGPWSYERSNPTRVTGPSGETIAATYGGFVGSEQQFANARLIASAPAMYEYLFNKASTGDDDAKTVLEDTDQQGT